MLILRILIILSLITVRVFAQTNRDTITTSFASEAEATRRITKLLLGLNFQGSSKESHQDINQRLLELGVQRQFIISDPYHPSPIVAYGVSTEFEIRQRPIIGFKASAWTSFWFFALAINTVYYTDFTDGNFKIRPEFGIGAAPFKLTLGYNIPTVYNKAFERMRYADMQVSFAVFLSLRKTKTAVSK